MSILNFVNSEHCWGVYAYRIPHSLTGEGGDIFSKGDTSREVFSTREERRRRGEREEKREKRRKKEKQGEKVKIKE